MIDAEFRTERQVASRNDQDRAIQKIGTLSTDRKRNDVIGKNVSEERRKKNSSLSSQYVRSTSYRGNSLREPEGSSSRGSPRESVCDSTTSDSLSTATRKKVKRNSHHREAKSAPARVITCINVDPANDQSKKLRSSSLACPSEGTFIISTKKNPISRNSRFRCPTVAPRWPRLKMDNVEDKDVNIVNTVPLLEDGIFPALPMDACSCSPKDKLIDNQCSTMVRADEDCCLAEWMRKEFYFETKARVEEAVKDHKIFLIRGDLPKLKEALEERGWIQKYESRKTRMVPYGSVASLDAKSLGNIRLPDGTLNEGTLIFTMLRHKPPDFIWDCRNDFVDWDCSIKSDTILNRFQKSFVYTSKLGMAYILQDAHWVHEDNVSSVQFPRSYNLSREPNSFIRDFRQTAVMGLLRWFIEQVQNGQDIINQGIDPIPINQLEFAIKRCEEFLVDMNRENLDEEDMIIEEDEWNVFLDDYTKVLHKRNGIAVPHENAQARLEKYYLSATSVMKKLKDIDPQYELNGTRNMWILKPSDLRCGTGISISHNLKDICNRVQNKPKDYFVVQKYIERHSKDSKSTFPLFLVDLIIIFGLGEPKYVGYELLNQFREPSGNHKNVSRPIIILDTKYVRVAFHREALLRFSSKLYTFSTYHEVIHICNTAIQEKYDGEKRRKKRGNFDGVVVESVRDQGWDCEKLNEYLKNTGYKGEPYYDEIYPKMVQAIVSTMLASQEYMDKRRCSFELYGADFMVMEDLSVWLIEINTNPRMHPPSSKVSERLYSAVLESLIKVIIDLPSNESCDTGDFALAYRQNIPDFQPYFGPCLFVLGKSITMHEQTPRKDKEGKKTISSPWGKQRRAGTAHPMIRRLRDPKVVDFIDYLNNVRSTAAH